MQSIIKNTPRDTFKTHGFEPLLNALMSLRTLSVVIYKTFQKVYIFLINQRISAHN